MSCAAEVIPVVAERTNRDRDDVYVVDSVDAAVRFACHWIDVDELPADELTRRGVQLLAERLVYASASQTLELATLTDDVLASLGNPVDLERALEGYWQPAVTRWGIA